MISWVFPVPGAGRRPAPPGAAGRRRAPLEKSRRSGIQPRLIAS